MDSPYIYKRLPRAGQIRLLTLQPGTSGDIHFTLTTANLHENPEYEVISYCWGDPSNPKTVYCDGKSIHITNSLYTALRRFRKLDSARILWADAVCINQKDNVEKGQQVNLMSSIYSQPQAVLIWLGDDMTGLEGLEESMRVAMELLPPETEDQELLVQTSRTLIRETAALRKAQKPNLFDHNWTPLNHLLCCPWFDRRWIIQETAMAPPHIPRLAFCGPSLTFPWPSLASICYRIGSYGLVAPIAGLSVVNRHAPSMASFFLQGGRPLRTLALTYFVMLIGKYRHVANLVDAVTATALFSCTEPRDHLYSLVNLTVVNGDIVADYRVSVEGVCVRFAVAGLGRGGGGNLRVLSLAPHTFVGPGEEGVRRLDLPSWVPDLTCQGAVNPMVSYTIRKQLFHAGGDGKGVVVVSPDEKLLFLRGRVVDRVEALTRCNVDVPYPHPELELSVRVKGRMRDWLAECRGVAADGEWEERVKVDEGRKLRDAFAMAVVCGMTGMRDPMPEDVLPMVDVFMGYVTDFFDPEFRLSEELRETLLTHGLLIEQSLSTMGEARRFCRTEEGRLGQVRKEARVGDLVCVILGAEVPYLVRPVSDGRKGLYELVGDCYVNGIMQGEALVDERYETVDIVLA